MDTKSPLQGPVEKPSQVLCLSAQGVELHGTVRRVSRHAAVVEFYEAQTVLRVSEVLDPCRLFLHERSIYCGRAVVTSLHVAGSAIACEISLDESGFAFDAVASSEWKNQFMGFLHAWQHNYRVRPDYKIAVADLQTFLADLCLWLQQAELAIGAAPTGDRAALEHDAVRGFAAQAIPALTKLFEKCEAISARLDPDEVPAHCGYIRRQIHPLVLCSPFCHRTFFKPLGYAGDYEMVNMITRDPCEGDSIFAKVVNCWFLAQAPAEAHRNRLDYLVRVLSEETVRAWSEGGPARVLNLGCGPAFEIQRFLAEKSFSDHVRFTLVDFNEETIAYTRKAIATAQKKNNRTASFQFIQKSVNQILKDAARTTGAAPALPFDFVYCAGLTDYLTDAICRRLINLLYKSLAPDGLLVVTNVADTNPRIETMEHVMQWHLIYRSSRQLAALAPSSVASDAVRVFADTTGVNYYLEVRKPRHV